MDFTIHANSVHELTRKLAQQKDEFIFEQFERFGYNKQDLFEMASKGRIQALETYNSMRNATITDYVVDNRPLFRTIEKIGFADYTIDVEEFGNREKNN